MNYELFFIGIYIALSIYHFFVYLGRKHDLSNLFYSLFCSLYGASIYLRNIYPHMEFYNDFFFKIIFTWIVSFQGFALTLFATTVFDLRKFKRFIVSYFIVIVGNQIISTVMYLVTNSSYFISIVYIVHFGYTVVFTLLLFHMLVIKKQVRSRREVIVGIGYITVMFFIIFYCIANSLHTNLPQVLNRFVLLFFAVTLAYALTEGFNREHESLVELKNTLEEKVKSRTRQIITANNKKTNFFINLAHETKTPLTLIINYLEKYMKNNKTSKELEIVKQNLDFLVRNMVNFLDIEKLNRGQVFYDHDQILNISTMISNKLVLFKEIAFKRGIVIREVIEKGLFIRIDPFAIDRIVNNLLDNAVKYSNNNGVVKVFLESTDESVLLVVEDNGIGIAEDQLNHIFNPYFQLSHKKRNIQGIGIGLSIVKKIVDEVNGTITVKSKNDQGTIFKIIFNKYMLRDDDTVIDDSSYSKPIDNVPVKNLVETEYKYGRCNILIVEDNVEMLCSLQDNLKEKYNVFYALDGQDALIKLKSIPRPDIIVSDIMMDTMDGYEFSEKLYENSTYSDIPLIFLTAKTSTNEKVKGLSKGAVDFIYKPFLMDELLLKVNSIIQNKKAQKESDIKEIEEKISKIIRNDDDDIQYREQKRFDEKCLEYKITTREKEVILMILEGYENKEISDKLDVSINTIKKHVQRIYSKCSVQNRVEIVKLMNG